MSTRAEAEYVGRRAELLAQLVLTRRKGVSVLSLGSGDVGIDLVAHLPPIPVQGFVKPIQPSLAVLVKGTSEELDRVEDASAYARESWKPRSANPLILSPVVVLLFSMEGDQGFYSWLEKPRLYPEGAPGLVFLEKPDKIKSTLKSIEHVFDEVEAWYTRMAQILLRPAS
jgi:hypothetical protein